MRLCLTCRVIFPCLGSLYFDNANAHNLLAESRLTLQLRNVYFSENLRDENGISAHSAANAKSERTEWAQGFLMDYQSGYTAGRLGVGIDALGLLGVKLNSGRGRSGTGLLPLHDDGRAADEFTSLGVTARAKFAKNRYQTWRPPAQVTSLGL